MDVIRRAELTTRTLRAVSLGTPTATLAQAADTDEAALTARLEGRDDLNVADLIGISGFFRIDPADFLNGATA